LKSNEDLRKKVLRGETTVQEFVLMDMEELANDSTKNYRQERARKRELATVRIDEGGERKLKKTRNGIIEIDDDR